MHALLLLAALAASPSDNCAPATEKQALAFVQEHYHETPVWMGTARQAGGTRFVVTQSESGSWSLLGEPNGPAGPICMLAAGDNGPSD